MVSHIRFRYHCHRGLSLLLAQEHSWKVSVLFWVKVLFEGYTAKTSSDSRKNETNIFEAKHKILSFGQFLLVSADIDFKAVKLMSDKELDNNITITHSPLLSCVGGN